MTGGTIHNPKDIKLYVICETPSLLSRSYPPDPAGGADRAYGRRDVVYCDKDDPKFALFALHTSGMCGR